MSSKSMLQIAADYLASCGQEAKAEAVRAAEQEIATLNNELQSDADYDKRVGDPRQFKYLNPLCCTRGCQSLVLTARVTKLTAAATLANKLLAKMANTGKLPTVDEWSTVQGALAHELFQEGSPAAMVETKEA